MSASITSQPLSVQLMPGRAIVPDEWDRWAATSPQASLYTLHGYASALCPDWQVLLATDAQGQWQAALPLAISRKWGQKLAYTPFFAQTWGPMLAPHAHTGERRYAHERACLHTLAQALRGLVSRAGIQAHPSLGYASPFVWAGFRLETRYTWQISLAQDAERLWQQVAASHQRQVRKGDKNRLRFGQVQDLNDLRELARDNAQEGHPIWQGGEATAAMYLRIASYLHTSQRGQLYGIFDGEQLLAAGLFADAFGTRHYLAGAAHPAFRNTGAMTLLLWQAIAQAQHTGLAVFDFEGSMQPGIEAFFRKFGAAPKPYLQIRRTLLAQIPLLRRLG